MIRRPLRPLAGVIGARSRGEDPDLLEAHRRAERTAAARAQERRRAEWRLTLLGLLVAAAFGAVAVRMALVATALPEEPQTAVPGRPFGSDRADITDRNGILLATNLPVSALYFQPRDMLDPKAAALGLKAIFPDIDAAALEARFRRGRFFFIRQTISPEERQRVHDLGEPGLQFAPREMRLYPAGRAVAHVIGATSFGALDVSAAELIGTAGVERWFDARLRDPAQAGTPLALSIDLPAQVAMREVLAEAVRRYSAKGAAGILLDARSGEIVSMVSLPDFDPNDRPEDVKDQRLFNRAAQGIYELGSTFKLFTAAMVMDRGIAGPGTMVNTTAPLVWNGFDFDDFHRMPPVMSLRDVMVQSSNVGTARLALMAGVEAQQEFLGRLGLLETLPVELSEARAVRPKRPARWTELSLITISFGHGLSASPLHLAAAYASLLNGGLRVRPTLLKGGPAPTEADRVVSAETSRQLRSILRAVVEEPEGTGNFAEVPGYLVGGKTGTADLPAAGGYDRSRTITTFAAVFPTADPKYVLVVSLDQASTFAAGQIRRTAGWTAAPVAGETIRRLAPILGLRPIPEAAPDARTVPIPVRN